MLLGIEVYWITWFPGSLLAIFGCLTLLWKAIIALTETRTTIIAMREVLPKVQAEFSPNSGHSMKDRVEALHTKTDKLAWESGKWQRQHAKDDDRRFAKVEASLERIEDKLGP